MQRGTSGFQKTTVFCTCERDVWLSRFHGRRSGITDKQTLYSPTKKAVFGLASGLKEACPISRMERSRNRTQPLMGWAKARSPTFDSIRMRRYGSQPNMAV